MRAFLLIVARSTPRLGWPALLLLVALLGLSLCPGAEAQPEPATVILPHGWHPSLEQARAALEGDLKTEQVQSGMNQLSRAIADLADAQLFVVYVRLGELLPPPARKALQAEQARWLKARSRLDRKSGEAGGSVAALESNEREIDFTDRRRQELAGRLATVNPLRP